MARGMQCVPSMRTPARLHPAVVLTTAILSGLGLTSVGCSSADGHPDVASDSAAASTDPPPRAQSCAGCVPGEQGAPGAEAAPAGPPAPRAAGEACAAADECASLVCAGAICQAPSPTDGVRNGGEADVDCGGGAAPRCAAGLACAAASDCASRACGADGKCQVAPSCTGGLGAGDQCGPNGESCCASARVPEVGAAVDYSMNTVVTTPTSTTTFKYDAHVSAFRLDKYEVTVGRLRSFFKAMNGNPQANFEATMGPDAGKHPKIAGSGWKSTWNKRLPASFTDIDSRYGDPALTPNGGQFCMRGAHGDYGTTTWTPSADTNPSLVDNFEVKPVVCIDWYTLFAFCAWDGGRLPTTAEWGAAAGDDQGYTYPWGGAPMSNANVVTALNAFVGQWPNFTWGLTYRTAYDRGTHVAPVGSKAATRYGIYDLGGNAMEWLLDSKLPSGTCTDCADLSNWKDPVLAWPNGEAEMGKGDVTWKDGGYRVVRGGSWEGHDPANVKGTWNGMEVGFTYHALGGRCARDL